ncbi:ankyrin repeat domain-containing protein [Planctomyces sp. SH-PL62]|uniref:ankyrin repeat domain-containing protein n=1 Tax=Planctomyces sp. SH-PL62 TaxID=1636152 RepID=UPI00078E54AF|nr:ankyrin repeat domain-containing protein [Planctomyces sp. SH-PL62]AMV39960.1 Ankyrin repeats (3 copies) [Planctomyces sp. SH-PL62]
MGISSTALTFLLAVGFTITSLLAAAYFFRSSIRRWIVPASCLAFLGLSALFVRHLYQAFWLDERLFIAAVEGDVGRIKSLLAAGADPNATWEDGTSALEAARHTGSKEVVEILRRAGAIEQPGNRAGQAIGLSVFDAPSPRAADAEPASGRLRRSGTVPLLVEPAPTAR